MILLIVFVYTTHQSLIYQFDANLYNRDGWEDLYSNCNFNTCGAIIYFGLLVHFNNIVISRMFLDLEPHSHIILDAKIITIDHNFLPSFHIDSQWQPQTSVIQSQSQICDDIQQDYVYTISMTRQHNRRSAWIHMYCNFKVGLISLKLSIIKCQYERAGCIENYSIFCLLWKLHQYSLNNKLITNSEGWSFGQGYSQFTYFYCENCQFLRFQEINYSTQLPPHTDVLIRFFKLENNIIVNYLYGKQTITFAQQKIEILILNHYDPILYLNIKTQIATDYSYIRDFEVFYTQPQPKIILNQLIEGCLEQLDDKCLICQNSWIYDKLLENCHPICGYGISQGLEGMDQNFCQTFQFGIFYQYQDGVQSQPVIKINSLNEGCLWQIDNKCLKCQKGQIWNEFLENCHPICGDGVIQGEEECDDGNQISNDSCHLCKYQCIEFCQICQFGICVECQDGFAINSNFNCDPLCGDGKLIPFSAEQCELTVNGVYDRCQDCQFIPDANCKTTYYSICLQCEVGYQMIENICLPYCGDQIVTTEEDCDDGNLQPYDGCFQCNFQCVEDCNICDKGNCIQKCEDGYKIVNNSCQSVCGDQIVTTEEDCDDGNLQPYDGCFQCKYSCPEKCYDCYQGNCLECNYQYQLLISNQCIQQLNCGDGLISGQEECDDGNYQAVDGCNNCKIEQNWICKKEPFSQCTFLKAPNLIINYINMTQNKQYIKIQFDQKVQIQTTQPLSKTINFHLSNLDKNNWNSSLHIIQDVGQDVSFGEFIVQIEINQLLEFRPVFIFSINQSVTNIDDAILYDVEKSITLQYPKFLDKNSRRIHNN